MSNNSPSASPETVFCHQCSFEWPRDDRGLSCPSCHSEFTEIIERSNDPRESQGISIAQNLNDGVMYLLQQLHQSHNPSNSSNQAEPSASADTEPTVTPTNITDNADDQQTHNNNNTMSGQEQSSRPAISSLQELLGNFATMIQGMVGGGQNQSSSSSLSPPNQYSPSSSQEQTAPSSTPAPTPGSPQPSQQQQPPPHATFTSTFHSTRPSSQGQQQQSSSPESFFQRVFAAGGPFASAQYGTHTTQATGTGTEPRFMYTTSTRIFPAGSSSSSSTSEQGDNPIFDIPTVLNQILFGPVFGTAPLNFTVPQREGGFNAGFIPPTGNSIAALFSTVLNPNGVYGDAVYTQEAFDRIITQLMEQNVSGNAPGPASAEAIAALPKVKLDLEMLDGADRGECSICMEEVTVGMEVTRLYCGHWFHGECINAWLSEHDTCPHCRKGIMDAKENPFKNATSNDGNNDDSGSAQINNSDNQGNEGGNNGDTNSGNNEERSEAGQGSHAASAPEDQGNAGSSESDARAVIEGASVTIFHADIGELDR